MGGKDFLEVQICALLFVYFEVLDQGNLGSHIMARVASLK